MNAKKYTLYTDAIAAVNDGRPVPRRLGPTGEFSLQWKDSGGYRGYYNVTAHVTSGWQLVNSDWMTGDWPDAGEHASSSVEEKLDKLAEVLEAEGYEMAVIVTPTSNVFSSAYDVFKRPRYIE